MHAHSLEITLLAAAMACGAALGGCHVTRSNAEHCYHAQGDQTCAELDPSRPYCAAPGCDDPSPGCVADPPPNECYSPCGHDTHLDDDATCIELGGESTDTGTTEDTETGTQTSTQTGDESCVTHDDCPAEAAYCLNETCIPCDGAPDPTVACFALTEGQATICLDGECVECTAEDIESCVEAELICDVDLHACVPCTAHDQCAGGAGCDLAMGECLPADAVWHVDGDGGQDFTTIAEALAALGSGSGTLVIHERDTPGYAEGISFSGDHALAGAVG